MDLMQTEYEFLDLSDVKEAELCCLQSALFDHQSSLKASVIITDSPWLDSTIEVSPVTLGVTPTPTPPPTLTPTPTVSSVESVSGGDEMAPHSPPRAPPPPPPHYHQPPPPPPPPYHPQWQVAPPNVYVSQVTANVNVHGYMGQYYQPQQYSTQLERPPRPHRRDRRAKRPPSPPAVAPAQPPYYVQYPPHYYPPPPAQAQGAPLYHLPLYQPLAYVGPYAYHHCYPDYPMPVDPEHDKPDDYPAELMLEHEAVDAYYHYPPYHTPDGADLNYAPPPPPLYLHHPHHMQHQPQPHQFNVYAKNFVLNKNDNELTPTASAAEGVESLQIKDLKITPKEPGSPKRTDHTPEPITTKPVSPQNEKASLSPKSEPPKAPWTPTDIKVSEAATSPQSSQPPLKVFSGTTAASSATNQVTIAPKVTPPLSKTTKGPTAPFSNAKQTAKPPAPMAVAVQQSVSIPKPPFGNRKRDGPINRSPSGEGEITEKPIEHKREPPLPPSKAPMPISITLHAQGPPSIVTNKSPFSHSRKSLTTPEAPPPPQPPPPAPTASDFPPPPTPRNRGEPVPAPTIVPQPAPGKSWASLFSKSTPVSVAPTEEPSSPTSLNPPSQKPVAKVLPFDASPLQQGIEKTQQSPRPTAPSVSYSEKTSVNAISSSSAKPASPPIVEVREVLATKEAPPSLPVQPSPFADDPNSYRMGEFLSKYQLDNRSVALLPRGLTNRSNYCYVNAILQALIACPPFYNMLKALPYQTRRGKSSTPVIDAMVELCYEFSPLVCGSRVTRGCTREGASAAAAALPVQTGPPLDPAAGQKVLRALRPFPGSQEGRQEDAEEFLGCLLNGLNDEMLELMKLVEPEESKEQGNGVIAQELPLEEDEDDDEWKVMGPRNRGAVERRWAAGRSPLSDVFRGRTRCRTHHTLTHHVTDAVQPFFTLQLDMERANNVKDALELLAGKDTLEGVSDAWQQLSIEQLPVVLLLHLKCFQLDADGHTAKIVKNVDFPIDLKIDPKIMSTKIKYTSKQRLYKLFAVVYHEGVEAVKGHYLTDTYHGQAGWIRYDDSTVTLVSDTQVLKPKPPRMPYLLMYRRQDTLPVPHRSAPKTE